MSDQDFFFDEDERPAAKTGGKKASTSGKASSPAPRDEALVTAQGVAPIVVVLIGVIGLLLGAVIGLFIGKGMATPAGTASNIGVPAASVIPAPQLTEEQLSTGELPSGHPQVGAPTSTDSTSGK